ncbi:MAG TPA: hypothetical protein VE907_02645 [Gammaproteobacteria bacterium]|nr:hypothetical protein [Gammaproteobacteria bacterium]
MIARVLLPLLMLLPSFVTAQGLDPSTYTLTDDAAAKYVRATQQLAGGGLKGPSMQGPGGMDLAKFKATLDATPAAQQALSAAGLSSTDYVLFMGAAMQAMMVGQMEQAGVKGMLPPGVTKRPPQGNLDYMKKNADLFQRSMTPGASATASNKPRVDLSDTALPVPKEAGSVLPSAILAKIPALTAIKKGSDCALADLKATVKAETARTQTLYDAYYGNPGMSGDRSVPAVAKVLDAAESSDLTQCGQLTELTPRQTALQEIEEQKRTAMSQIATETSAATQKCPNVDAFEKDKKCMAAVQASNVRKVHEAEVKYLQQAQPAWAALVSQMRQCSLEREAIVAEAKAADVKGANVKLVLRPLVQAWEIVPISAAEQWTGICEDAQHFLQPQ